MNGRWTRAALVACVLALWLPLCAGAQGFAGLGAEVQGFSEPRPAPQFTFPQDHGAHPDYRIEWWYLTANLTRADGTPMGLQWTLFRSALAPETRGGWSDPQIWFAHAAVTTPDAHHVAQRFARGGIGQAGVRASPFEAWIDDWSMAGPDFDRLRLRASGPDFAYDLALIAKGPLVFHGDGGFSVKSDQGQASYYYSQPSYAVEGEILLHDGPVQVTGSAWLDREWSSQPLAETQTGWDWFSLSFDSGDKLMGFQLRQTDGGAFTSGTWIAEDGTVAALPNAAFRAQPLDTAIVAGRSIPVRWSVTVPSRGVAVTVSALNPQAYMDVTPPYWEGPVTVAGSHGGRGYLEMTGYD